MPKILANALLGLCSLVLTFGALELAFRLVPIGRDTSGWNDRPEFYYDPAGAKNHTGQNHSAEKPANTFRVAVVGDSYSFGPFMQYDDTFAARLGRMLNLNGQEQRAEVINYGIPGYSTSHEVDLVKRAISEGADLVLLQITLNDAEAKPFRPAGVIIKTNPYGAVVLTPETNRIVSSSKLLTFVANRWYAYRSADKYKEYFFNLFKESKSGGLSLFTRSLGAINKLCRDKNVPLVAAIFPLFGTNVDAHYPFNSLHQTIAELLNDNRIPYIDLKDSYLNIPTARLQVIPGVDFHPNEIAHRIAAESLYAWLVGKGFIPETLSAKTLYQFRHHVEPTDEDRQFELKKPS